MKKLLNGIIYQKIFCGLKHQDIRIIFKQEKNKVIQNGGYNQLDMKNNKKDDLL